VPLAGYAAVPDKKILDAQRRMAHAFNLPIVWGTDPTLNGRTLSAARDAGVPGIYCEYLGSASCSQAGVDAYIEGCLNVMAEFDMIQHVRQPSRVVHFIEDTRPNVGHLQICHPAPIDGYFAPNVKLGDKVRKGDIVGSVCDSMGDEKHNIVAEQTGMVIVLHTYPRVAKNTGVLVVLEM
jgi:predicted deacylase